MTYDFYERLAFSQGEHENSDIEILKQFFSYPNHSVNIQKTDINIDKSGIDYIITLDDGAKITIDAKRREKGASKFWSYGEAELAIETWSVFPPNGDIAKGKIGWTYSRATNVDYILFTFDKSDWEYFYILPYQLLRIAAMNNFQEWRNMYSCKKQSSKQWQSESIFIPVSVVMEAIKCGMKSKINKIN